MSTTGNMGRQAPDGHHWVLRPTSEVEPGHAWQVLSQRDHRTCQWGGRNGIPACGAVPVARLNLAQLGGE
jgi:hypothetical protein